MILVIDNYDSFTYNLVQYIGELGGEQVVVRNDRATVDEVLGRKPDSIVISPGPCTPAEAGISVELVRRAGDIPILGVCLGHQAIGEAFGGKVVRAPYIVHGKTSAIFHKGTESLFRGIPTPFTATRYHSLIVDRQGLPDSLEVTAWTEDGLIMGLRHRSRPVHGVQFHPESIGTPHGKAIVKNFLEMTRTKKK
jgi:anthranilate synthase/aminodeoxychorismate synthase-like glutamine amidotransferase